MSLLLAVLLFSAPCTPVVDSDTIALRTAGFGGAPGWTDYQVTVTLKTREVSGTRAEDAVKQVFHRTLSAAEVNALKSHYSRTCLVSSVEATVDGGARFEAIESDGGVRQVLLSNQLAFELTDVFPWPDSPRPPVLIEDAVVTFLKEAYAGTPFGPPDVRWSFSRLDPKYFELSPMKVPEGFQLDAKSGAALPAWKLTKAMSPKPPAARLIDPAKRRWVLGFTKALEPTDAADAPIQVFVTLPVNIKATSASQLPFGGTRVEQIVLRTSEP